MVERLDDAEELIRELADVIRLILRKQAPKGEPAVSWEAKKAFASSALKKAEQRLS